MYKKFLKTQKTKNQVIKTLNDLESLIQTLENQKYFYDRDYLIMEVISFLKDNEKFLNELDDPYAPKININHWKIETSLFNCFKDHLIDVRFYSDQNIKKSIPKVLKTSTDLFRELTLNFLL